MLKDPATRGGSKAMHETVQEESQLHYEFLSAELVKFDTDGAFEVKLASSRKIVLVPREKKIIEVLAEAGIEV